jgi:hypothetical protein
VIDICPYLAGDAGWKSLSPSKRHRCSAAGDTGPLSADKQRRLCLTPRHAGCATYQAAQGIADELPAGPGDGPSVPTRPEATTMWAFNRPTPVLLEPPRFALPSVGIGRAPGVRQASLAAVMVVAFAVLFAARLADPELNDGTGAVAGVQGTPAVETARPNPSRRAVIVPAPTRSASPASAAAASSPPSPEPVADRTYRVASGDTLYEIAARHGTTVKAIADLNGLGDGSYLKIGQKLRIP